MTINEVICSNEKSNKDIIYFKDGIYGLEHLKKYKLLSPQEDLPFKYLQSIEESALALIVIDPYLYMPDYNFDIYDDLINELEVEKPSDLQVLCIVVIPKDISKMTANFAAPILINVNTLNAKQIILEDYETKYPIYEAFKTIQSQGAKKC